RRPARGLRAVLPQLLDLPLQAGVVPGGPVRAPGVPRPWPGTAADGAPGQACGRARLRALRVERAGLERAGDRLLSPPRRAADGRVDRAAAGRRGPACPRGGGPGLTRAAAAAATRKLTAWPSARARQQQADGGGT